jgi:hypothetical protein
MTTIRRKKTTGRDYADGPVLTSAIDDNDKREEDKRSGLVMAEERGLGDSEKKLCPLD